MRRHALILCLVFGLVVTVAEAVVINATQVEDAISTKNGNSFFGTGSSAAGEVEVGSQRSANFDPTNNRAARTFAEFVLTQPMIDEAAALAGGSQRAKLRFDLEQIVNGPGNLEGLDIRYFGITGADRSASTLWNTASQETAQNVIYATTSPGTHSGTFSNALVVTDIGNATAGDYIAFGLVTDRGVDNSVVVGGPPSRQVYLLDDPTSVFSLSFTLPKLLVTPTAIAQTQGNAGQPITNLINNSGLSGVPDVSNYTTLTHAGGVWYTATALPPNYYDNGGTPPQFVLNLDKEYELTDLVLWGYGGNANEAAEFLVEFSLDGGGIYYDSAAVMTSSLLGTGNATLTFGQVFRADTVRLTMTDNAGGLGYGGGGSGDRVGLGEIKLLANTPEPTSLALLGLGGLALMRRRRKR